TARPTRGLNSATGRAVGAGAGDCRKFSNVAAEVVPAPAGVGLRRAECPSTGHGKIELGKTFCAISRISPEAQKETRAEKRSPPLPGGERACPGPDPGSVLAFGEDWVRGHDLPANASVVSASACPSLHRGYG